MTDGNGGAITVGERLRRIEERLDSIEDQLEARIARHKQANQEAVEKLADFIAQDVGKRLIALETKTAAEDAAHKAREESRNYTLRNRHWVIGTGIALGMLLLAALGLLVQIASDLGT